MRLTHKALSFLRDAYMRLTYRPTSSLAGGLVSADQHDAVPLAGRPH